MGRWGGGGTGDRWVGGEDRVGLLVSGWGGRWRVGVGDCDGMVGGKNGQEGVRVTGEGRWRGQGDWK